MSLGPWDLAAAPRLDFDKHRRPSYLFSTNFRQQRSESYRRAARLDDSSEGDYKVDLIDDLLESRQKPGNSEQMPPVRPRVEGNGLSITMASPEKDKPPKVKWSGSTSEQLNGSCISHEEVSSSTASTSVDAKAIARARWKYRKNLVAICCGFILVFTAFRSLQNLQSSLNKSLKLGVLSMTTVHGSMVIFCFFVPTIINRINSKWSIVIAMLLYLIWIASNLVPSFFVMIPTSLLAGLAQGLAWTSQVFYLTKLTTDYSQVSPDITDEEIYRFNAFFVAGFQTSHIWGNLVSSISLMQRNNQTTTFSGELCGTSAKCEAGLPALYNMTNMPSDLIAEDMLMPILWHGLFALVGLLIVLFCLDSIGAHDRVDRNTCEFVIDKIEQLLGDGIFRCLIPLLFFNGFEQGLVYSDFTDMYIACSMGVQYIGFSMITFGLGSFASAFAVSFLTKKISREIILGMNAILHGGLVCFMLLWSPSEKQTTHYILFIISAMWGICDAVWQTHCNILIGLCCYDSHDIAFSNFRLLQGLGAATAFFLNSVVCLKVKFYILIGLLALSVIFYSFAEYKIKKQEREFKMSAEPVASSVPQIHVEMAEADGPELKM